MFHLLLVLWFYIIVIFVNVLPGVLPIVYVILIWQLSYFYYKRVLSVKDMLYYIGEAFLIMTVIATLWQFFVGYITLWTYLFGAIIIIVVNLLLFRDFKSQLKYTLICLFWFIWMYWLFDKLIDVMSLQYLKFMLWNNMLDPMRFILPIFCNFIIFWQIQKKIKRQPTQIIQSEV